MSHAAAKAFHFFQLFNFFQGTVLTQTEVNQTATLSSLIVLFCVLFCCLFLGLWPFPFLVFANATATASMLGSRR